MQKWVLIYTSHTNSQNTTFFESPDRETAEKHVDIFFRMLFGATLHPEILRSQWVLVRGSGSEGNDKVFEGDAISDENGGQSPLFRGVLYSTAELKPDNTLLDRLITTDLPPI